MINSFKSFWNQTHFLFPFLWSFEGHREMPFQALVMIITTSVPVEIFFLYSTWNQTLTVYLSDKIGEGIHSFWRKSFRSERQWKLPKTPQWLETISLINCSKYTQYLYIPSFLKFLTSLITYFIYFNSCSYLLFSAHSCF